MSTEALPGYLRAPAPRPWEAWLREVQGDGEPLPLSPGSRLGPLLRRLPPRDMRLPPGKPDPAALARFELRSLPGLATAGGGNGKRAPLTAAESRAREEARAREEGLGS